MSSGTNAGSNGWTHDFVGYVFPLNEGSQGGMVSIAVGHETTYWSNLVQRGEYIQVWDLLESYYSPSPCLLYTSPSPRDKRQSRMPSSA